MSFCKKCSNITEITKSSEANKIGHYYICRLCNHMEEIKPGTILFNKPTHVTVQKNIFCNENKIHDPTLPVTRNYICPNDKCPTNKQNVLKEAVMYRINEDTYTTYYICKVCKTNW